MATFESLKQPLEWERTLHQQESPYSPLPMQAHLGLAPIHSDSSPALQMLPTMSHIWPAACPDDAAKNQELLQAPSSDQIKTFQQRAWNSKEFQIELHERVAEMSLDAQQKKTLYHLIHQRDIDSIRDIIELATMDNQETSTDEESTKEKLKENKEKLTNLKNRLTPAEKADTRLTPVPAVFKASVKPFLSARLPFKRTSRNLSRMRTAHILQVPGTGKKEEDIFNVHLVRYFVEKVWKLERPHVIISVTGGAAKNFDLRPEYNENLMRGMMEGTRRLTTWSVSIYVCISFLSV